MSSLTDSFGREFHYLRLSVTDACNFRCTYCLPDGYQKPLEAKSPLSVSEVENLVSAFAELGFWKVRLTGGEPTLRRDLVSLASVVAGVPGIRRVALSTNGYRLRQLAPELKAAGVSAINISLDSIDPETFARTTGRGDLANEVLAGIDRALDCGFDAIKINAVLMRGVNDGEIARFMDWIRERPVSVRFIELMRTGKNKELFDARHLSAGELKLRLLSSGWVQTARRRGDGPAVEFESADYQGRIGIIAPYSKDFCATCNRLRVSSQGGLRLCLFGEGDFSLRPWLHSAEQRPELVARIRTLIGAKPEAHDLHGGNFGSTWNFAAIGG